MTLPPSFWKSRTAYCETLPKPWTLGDRLREARCPARLQRLAHRVDDAVAGRLGAAERAAHADRLAGDEAGVLAAVDRLRTRRASRACAGGWSSRRAPARPGRGRRCAPPGAPSRGRSAPARAADRLCGSQMTPPLAPPSGMSTTAHFHVIHMERARTVSTVSCGWKRMPPFDGPRASLCWTRNPRKTFTFPSSMRHRDREVVLADGERGAGRASAGRASRMSAALSNWA